MTILLLGHNGQIGHELQRSLRSLGTVVPVGRERADLTRPDTLRAVVDEVAPDVIVNAAAYTNVDRAEEETERAWQINAEAPGVLADAAARCGAWLVHYSTDYVFDGTARRPYREDDRAVPLNAYGRTKLGGERAIREAGPPHLILRASWVYSLRRSNFLRTMLRLADECRRGERERITVVDDQVGCPTSAAWVADATAELLQTVAAQDDSAVLSGTYHVASAGQTSWYGFARAIFAWKEIEDVDIVPISTDEYPTPATRPAYAVLDTSRVQETFGLTVPTWTEQLAAFEQQGTTRV